MRDIAPHKLVFGSGFGLPYGANDKPLDVEAVAAGARPLIDAFKSDPRFAKSECVLEMGRWLVGPAGWLLTGVVSEKSSRGVEFRVCDAGFNNHLGRLRHDGDRHPPQLELQERLQSLGRGSEIHSGWTALHQQSTS